MDPDQTARSSPHVHCQKATLTFQQKTKPAIFSKVSYSVDNIYFLADNICKGLGPRPGPMAHQA